MKDSFVVPNVELAYKEKYRGRIEALTNRYVQ